MNYNNLCYRCFAEKPIPEKACPKCGYVHTPTAATANCLLPGTVLHNRYIVGIALGVGGFGITYKCLDTKIGGICAIKEYFPANFASRSNGSTYVLVQPQNLDRFNKIMKRFVKEAELVKTLNHRNVITIYDSFFANSTAYYVMEYCDGIDLRHYTNHFTKPLGYDEGMNLLYQIMNAMEYLHSRGILHRDIAPDNIYVTSTNTIKILDFGSARREMDQFNKELSVIVKVGYAPLEQYGGRGKQGPYTDIYALGATFYHLFTSVTPHESTQRAAEDTMIPFSQLRPDLPDNLKFCIERCLSLSVSGRISSIAEMKNILGLSNENLRTNRRQTVKEKSPKRNSAPGYNNTSRKKANISLRMAAYMLDLLIIAIIYFVIASSFIDGIYYKGEISREFLGVCVLFPVAFTAINTIIELASSTSIGKAILGLRVENYTGGEVSPGQVVLRNLVKLLNVFVVVFADGDELLEDRITGSIVCVKE